MIIYSICTTERDVCCVRAPVDSVRLVFKTNENNVTSARGYEDIGNATEDNWVVCGEKCRSASPIIYVLN